MIVNYRELKNGQFFRQIYPKKNIVLHHTVSTTAESPYNWWNMTPERVATAFIIDRDGTILNPMPSWAWAYHLGLNTWRNGELNRRSIGIEIVNEGRLTKEDDVFRWGDDPRIKFKGWTYKHRGSLDVMRQMYRGYEYWPVYDDRQYLALNELLTWLLKKYNLPKTIYKGIDFNPGVVDSYTVYSHCNVRSDKTDVSPAFDFNRIIL